MIGSVSPVDADLSTPVGAMRPRILLILPTLHAGGAENYALRFIRFVGSQGVEWHVLTPFQERGDLHQEFEREGVQIHRHPLGYLNPIKAFRFHRFLQRLDFDTICSLNGIFSALPLLLGRLAGVDRRIACHRRSSPAYDRGCLRDSYAKVSTWLLQHSATKILSNSEAALDYFHGPAWRRDPVYKVIMNGVDSSIFSPESSSVADARSGLGISKDSFLIGHVGRFDPAKNHETIMEVAQQVCSRTPSARFVFCGRGTDSAKFRALAVKHGVAERCFFLGIQHDMPKVYRSFDVFYFPSVTEGQPNALIEAMLMGVPIVASDIDPIRAALPPNLHSFLVPPLDASKATERIMSIQGGLRQDLVLTLEWAKKIFDPSRNFSLFLSELTHDCRRQFGA